MPAAGPKWNSNGNSETVVTWSFGDFQIDLSRTYSGYKVFDTKIGEYYRSMVVKAFGVWEAVAKIDFVQVSDSASSNIRLGNEYIDGASQSGSSTLGQAQAWWSGSYYKAAQIYFDSDAYMDESTFFEVAIHEIGHAIGLSHSASPSDIMYFQTNSQNKSGALSATDISVVQSIYGARATIPTGSGSVADAQFAAASSSIFFLHKSPTSNEFAARTDFAEAQYNYYANVLKVGMPSLGPYEAFGAAVSAEAVFRSDYNLSINTTVFIQKAYNAVNGRFPTDVLISVFTDQVNYFRGLYQGIGMSAVDAEYKARGAVAGQIVGWAMTSDIDKARATVTLDDEATAYLNVNLKSVSSDKVADTWSDWHFA